MVSLISSFASRASFTDSDTLLCLSSFYTFNPKTCLRFASSLSLLAARKGCGHVLGFLEVTPRKKGCSLRVLRMCNKRNLGWDSEGTKDLETEILEFMKNSDKPGMFPSKKDLIRSGRFDLVEKIRDQGGWLSMGWDLDEQESEQESKLEDVRLNENDVHMDKTLTHGAFDLSSDTSSSREEVDAKNESGIEGILTRLEKERNLSLGISLREKREGNSAMNDIFPNGSVPWSSTIVTASETQEVDSSRSLDENAQNRYQEAKSVSETQGLNDSSTSETWRTWSMRRAGFTDEDIEAAEIPSSGLDSEKKEDNTASFSEDISTTHIKGRLQNLQSELSSVLHSLRSHPDEVVTSKDSEITSGNMEKLYDDWEFKENEIIHAQDKLRSTRAKLAVLEGKMAMALVDAQRTVREKQRRIDNARRALWLLRSVSIVWPNSASEVLLMGSFDGWSTQRKMKKAQNGVFSLSLKLYPGRYEIKFIVDGQWKVDPLRPIVTGDGYENNLIIIY